jgi:hypothetical protein
MYIENDTDEAVTYTESGPGGGGSGCNINNLRPIDPETGELAPLEKHAPSHEDKIIPVSYRVCFFDATGTTFLASSPPIPSPTATVTLVKKDGEYEVVVSVRMEWVRHLLDHLGVQEERWRAATESLAGKVPVSEGG